MCDGRPTSQRGRASFYIMSNEHSQPCRKGENVRQTSGIDALLEALKQSGVNTGDIGGQGGASAGSASASDAGSTGNAGGSPFGGSPFGGAGSSPFGGGASPFGGGQGAGGNGGAQIPNIDLSFMDRFRDFSKKALVLLAIVVVLALAVAYWWFHPPINIHSVDTWTFIAIVILLPSFIFFLWKSRGYEKGDERTAPNPGKAKAFKFLSYVPLAVAVLAVVGALLSLPIIPGNAAKYSSVLETDTLEFAEDIQEVNYSEIPVIDREIAILYGNREMGAIPEYVSQFVISNMYSQINYQGEPVRVSPLGYADLIKWFTNREGGIPAYSLVNMTTQDAEIVRLGDSPIYYSQSEPLFRNIDRHVQLNYPFYMFDDFSFEIDEEGHPWWICPVQTRTIGLFGGTTISRVVLCDATTGECQDLAVEDCPQWVDGVYPADLLIAQYNWYGRYNNGWLNSFLGQENVMQTTPGTDGQLGYNYIAKDDDVWVYSGVTSATADESIIGIVLVNQRTQESHFYSVPGATEASAMASAEGQVQDLGYQATFPLLINVNGQPTYFMALKDGSGVAKQFAMIDIQRYQNVATGATVAECQKNYEALLAINGVASSGGVDEQTVQKASGVIRSMAQAVIEGNSHFYVTLVEEPGIFDFALPGLLEIVGYREGDAIAFTYLPGEATNTAYEITSEQPHAEAAGESGGAVANASVADESAQVEEAQPAVEE